MVLGRAGLVRVPVGRSLCLWGAGMTPEQNRENSTASYSSRCPNLSVSKCYRICSGDASPECSVANARRIQTCSYSGIVDPYYPEISLWSVHSLERIRITSPQWCLFDSILVRLYFPLN